MVLFLCECDSWQFTSTNQHSLTTCYLHEKGKPAQQQQPDMFPQKSIEHKLLRKSADFLKLLDDKDRFICKDSSLLYLSSLSEWINTISTLL